MSRFFEYENPFNLIAELIAHLRGLSAKDFMNKNYRAAIEPDERLETKVYRLLQGNAELSNKEILEHGIGTNGIAAIKDWEHYNSFYCVLELLVQLDQRLPWRKILDSTYVNRKLGNHFEALNENSAETGVQVIPRVPGMNELEGRDRKSWAVDWLPGINSELRNLYYVETAQLKNYSVEHIIVKKMPREGKRALRIAASPILKADVLAVDKYQEEEGTGVRNFFAVKCLKEPENIQAAVKMAYLKACEEEADILIFPEMLGFEAFAEDSDFLKSIQREAEEKNFPAPFLVFAPTWWHDKKNELSVFDDSGECLCVQQKQFSFLHKAEKKYYEDLSESKPIIRVLHVPEMGRIVCPICIDYIHLEYRAVLVETLRATMLVCPSYTNSDTLFDFCGASEIQNGCYTIWLNTCCATIKKKTPPEMIGYISGPETGDVCRLKPKCNGNCTASELACLFVANISWENVKPEIEEAQHFFGEDGTKEHCAKKRTVSAE